MEKIKKDVAVTIAAKDMWLDGVHYVDKVGTKVMVSKTTYERLLARKDKIVDKVGA
ncbi:hypothetical protein NVP1083O_29 [Vibrio phage 1.083.O._10N.286.52.B9]|nr:hypothetical protein NVP1083O_29 [Vibrio phage 1.083.O._10N.286.52.B9]AUS02263.1 hypothetical protein NVP2096O_28 [Vibrio phage 2.096.O._10N.286.48.B5]